MAIKIKNLEQIADKYTTNQYIYKDLALDITQTKLKSLGYKLPVPGVDIKASYDYAAIANSLTNLFNTLPGQRFLFPEYGLNFYRYLFEPINETNGEAIGNNIFDSIKTFEPRVTPQKVNVKLDPDNNQYKITIIVNIPMLNTIAGLDFAFNIKQQSFTFLQAQ